MLRRLSLTLFLALSCGSGEPQPASIAMRPALRAVQGCPAVEKAIQDAAVEQMRHQLEAQIIWRHRWGGGPVTAMGGPAGAGPATSTPAGPPSAWTTTNVQTHGVDEPDFVKNDG